MTLNYCPLKNEDWIVRGHFCNGNGIDVRNDGKLRASEMMDRAWWKSRLSPRVRNNAKLLVPSSIGIVHGDLDKILRVRDDVKLVPLDLGVVIDVQSPGHQCVRNDGKLFAPHQIGVVVVDQDHGHQPSEKTLNYSSLLVQGSSVDIILDENVSTTSEMTGPMHTTDGNSGVQKHLSPQIFHVDDEEAVVLMSIRASEQADLEKESDSSLLLTAPFKSNSLHILASNPIRILTGDEPTVWGQYCLGFMAATSPEMSSPYGSNTAWDVKMVVWGTINLLVRGRHPLNAKRNNTNHEDNDYPGNTEVWPSEKEEEEPDDTNWNPHARVSIHPHTTRIHTPFLTPVRRPTGLTSWLENPGKITTTEG
ncbi:hypothetical protein HETIRDRAFT_426265 [Heterobasidion irregulare TC 32-1]|uniref:Uncharacterized protein n=1 Tax=Heterobasidion irregulare (strain TC 32-1) TaxID=747525 RepID=W4KAB3_HETIT|nr:uncharacterized protein HETIRDRAFT_426265 [Heterobasidion irregulare TC 32-1]ETW82689.1 hypothetical protein HETIRDRAFT_426265 [Heterobasidion irregulare TC 32-1]